MMKMSRAGTPLYLAPELVLEQPYNYKVDVWGVGCLLYTLAQLETPFSGGNLVALGRAIVEDTPRPLPFAYSVQFLDFVNALMEKKPENRPNMQEALEMIPKAVKSSYKSPLRSQASFEFPLSPGLAAMLSPDIRIAVSPKYGEGMPLLTQRQKWGQGRETARRNEQSPIRTEGKLIRTKSMRFKVNTSPLPFKSAQDSKSPVVRKKMTIRDLVGM